MANLLDESERKAALPDLGVTGWSAVEGRDAIRKVWKFASFSEAWGFMTRAALAAEKLNHHPEWSNRYNVVDVTLTTHVAHGLTELDLKLARAMDRIAPPETEVQRDLAQPIACLCELHHR